MPNDRFANQPTAESPLAGGPAAVVDLRLLATSDMHMNIAPHDYYADEPCPLRGLALTATLIAQARGEARNCLLFDNGDFLQGSPFGDFLSTTPLGTRPVIDVMNRLGYDAANLGNHEFSGGIEPLQTAMGLARFPFVSSNAVLSGTGLPFALPRALLQRDLLATDGTRHRLKIGVLGVLPPQTCIWDRQAIAGKVVIGDMVAAAAAAVADLRQTGADIIVVLAHCGIGTADAGPMAENAGLAISRLNGVDALILGHTHLPFPGPATTPTAEIDPCEGLLNGVPTVMPGFFGSHLGVIDLQMQRSSAGSGWRVAARHATLRPVARRDASGRITPLVHPDPDVLSRIAGLHDDTRAWTRRPIARTLRPLHSFFAMVDDVPAIQMVHRAQIAHVRKRLAGSDYDGLPILSATAPFKAGGRGGPGNYAFVPPGEVQLRHAADMYLFPNTLVALSISGAELRFWLERAAQVFNTIRPGGVDQPLLNRDLPSFHFDSIGGLAYEIDLTSSPTLATDCPGRIRNLLWEGRPIRPDQQFILATNSYRASGSGGFLEPESKAPILSEGTLSRDVLIDHLRSAHEPGPASAPGWRLVGAPGTSVVFETSPLAAQHLSDAPHLCLTPLDLDADGFLRMRLAF